MILEECTDNFENGLRPLSDSLDWRCRTMVKIILLSWSWNVAVYALEKVLGPAELEQWNVLLRSDGR